MTTTPQIFDTFDAFEAHARTQGFDAVLVREWAPGTDTGRHTHPFAVQAQVVRGEFSLEVGETTRHLRAGETFALEAEVPHAERYGAQGATFWVARRHARQEVQPLSNPIGTTGGTTGAGM